MRLRRACPAHDEEPYLAGLVKCEHVYPGVLYEESRCRVYDAASCPFCHGSGWQVVPVVEDRLEGAVFGPPYEMYDDGAGVKAGVNPPVNPPKGTPR